MSHCVSFSHKDFISNSIFQKSYWHFIDIKMIKLYWKCFECVSFRYIVFNWWFKFFSWKSYTSQSFHFIIDKSCTKKIRKLFIPFCCFLCFIFSNLLTLFLQRFFKVSFKLQCVKIWNHYISMGQRRQWLNLLYIHLFPKSIIIKLKYCRYYSVICLNVCIKWILIEYTANCTIKSMYSWIS